MRTSIRLVAAAIMGILCWGAPIEALGQGQGRHAAVVIEISKPDDVCTYRVNDVEGNLIEGQQDVFLMRAGGFLNVVASGTHARVEIKNDEEKNVPGFERKGTLKLNSGDDGFLHVRAKRTENSGSRHKVQIDCCESFDSDGVCLGQTESQPTTYLNGYFDRGVNLAASTRLPEADLRLLSASGNANDAPVGSGGPDMDVDP